MRLRLILPSVLAICAGSTAAAQTFVPKWTRVEVRFTSSAGHDNALDTDLRVTFHAPSGKSRTVPAFWDGGRAWLARFAPDEEGRWTYSTESSDRRNSGLHGRNGAFTCRPPRASGTRFEQHGRVRISADGRRFEHEDGTPFFWLGDTAWNGPLWSTPEDWKFYIGRRAGQGFNAIQWVATQWRGSPGGDAQGLLPYSGLEKIRVNPDFFRRLDEKHDALARAGLLSVPVMLWAIASREKSEVNPGVSLPEEQAVRLARYMLARWGADPVVWFLNGDGDYRKEKAARWRTIGRGVFEPFAHAPVTLHPGGLMWVIEEFRQEKWLDICGYQSAHGDSDGNSRWIASGPPAKEWKNPPARPVISLEAPYERDGASDFLLRRNHLWSLLNAPPAGITYGAHGVWGWSDGVHPAPGHGTAVARHWKQLIELPGATRIGLLRSFFESIDYKRLEPAPEMLARQPGDESPRRFVSAARSAARDLAVIYTPEDRTIALKPGMLEEGLNAQWVKPETGRRTPAAASGGGAEIVFETPEPGDWLLLIR